MREDELPFTKSDAAALGTTLEKLFDAKLETLGERINGLRNWSIGVIATGVLMAGSSVATHQAPAQQIKTAITFARAFL